MEPFTRRHVFRLGALTGAAALLSGCADTGAEPVTPATSSGSASTQVPDTTDAIAVLQVTISSPPAPLEVIAAGTVPVLTVFDDGLVVTKVAERSLGAVPAQLQQVRREPAEVSDYLQRLADSGLLSGVDYGEPSITDQSSTEIAFNLPGSTGGLSIYAFGDGDALLDGEPAEHRRQLREFLDEAHDWVRTGSPEPFEPDAAVVRGTPAEESGTGESDDAVQWPGEDPAELLRIPTGTRSCGSVGGEQARTLLAAARDNPTALWRHQDELWHLVVQPMVPGQAICGF
ncbi:hypothetical protein ACF3NT_06315 [Naumannella halotolerans]|uniref:hypothetical protein n=1 Tax=Naumannella halotolerans TaxID=993414 RepID=UPI00370DB603